VAGGHLIGPGFDLFGFNLDRLTTFPTDQVMVVPFPAVPKQVLSVG
jgi:hypothetical protein